MKTTMNMHQIYHWKPNYTFTNTEIVLSDPAVTLDLCQKSCIELNLLISQSGCFGAIHRKSNPDVFLDFCLKW